MINFTYIYIEYNHSTLCPFKAYKVPLFISGIHYVYQLSFSVENFGNKLTKCYRLLHGQNQSQCDGTCNWL